MNLKSVLFVSFLMCFSVSNVYGLKCYTCSATEDEVDQTCADEITSSSSVTVTDCDKKYCTITRQEYLDPKGKLASMSRNCMDTVTADGVTEDSTHRFYQRSCKTDLCNNGTGKGSTLSSTSYLGDKSTIYAPGTGRSSAHIILAPVVYLAALSSIVWFV